MSNLFRQLLDTSGFVRRWDCGNWSEGLGWLHISADVAIWAAYKAIPLVIIYFARHRRDVSFLPVFGLFGAFILACGTTHLIDAGIFWQPAYRLLAVAKVVTALVSWITVVAVINILPRALALPGLARTVSALEEESRQRSATEAELREHRQRLALALEAGEMGIWEWDRCDNTTRLNRKQRELFGVGDEFADSNSKNFMALVYPDDQPAIREQLKRVREEGINFSGEFRIVRPDGSLRWLAGRGNWLAEPNGAPTRMIGVNYDITEQKGTEDRLRQAVRRADMANHAKSVFLANISHEIRTPMTAILGYAELLAAGDDTFDKKEAARTILDNGGHLLALINEILDLAKIESGHLELEKKRFSPARVLAEVIGLLGIRAEERQLTLRVVAPQPLPAQIEGDAKRFRQVIVNLLANAIKFTDQGQITVRVSWLQPADEATSVLEIAVSDTGRGIAAEDLERIFEPFEQGSADIARGHGGTGLGLTISRRLVHQMGGTLTVETTQGSGSTFLFRMPTGEVLGEPIAWGNWNAELQGEASADGEEPLGGVPKAARASAPALLGRRILIVDDTPANRKLIDLIVRSEGGQTVLAASGEEAIQALQADNGEASRGELPPPFNAVIMDMAMPGMDGFEATRRLRAAGCRLPIVALTAHALAEDRQRCLDAGCDEYLTKPIERAALVERLSVCVAASD